MPNFTEGEKEKKRGGKSTSGTASLPQPDGWGCEVGCLGLEWVKCGLFHFINGIKCNNVFFLFVCFWDHLIKNTDCICLTHFKDRKFTDPAFQVFDLLISLGITCYFKANKVWSSGQYLHRAAVRKKKVLESSVVWKKMLTLPRCLKGCGGGSALGALPAITFSNPM